MAVGRAGPTGRGPAAGRAPAGGTGSGRPVSRTGALDAAYAAAYETVSGPATATVRLLSLDPFDATAVLARLAPELDQIAAAATDAAQRIPEEGIGALPAASAPLLDITAQQHAAWPVRLFAS